MRLFFALWPNDATRAALAAAAQMLSLRDGRPVASPNLHMTLAFVGEIDSARVPALCSMAAALRAPSFTLDIAVAGWWRRSRAAWLAPREVPTALCALAMALQRGAGVAAQAADFQPHVTIARQVRRLPGLLGAFSVPWTIDSFALISSNLSAAGARYQALSQWPLATPVVD